MEKFQNVHEILKNASLNPVSEEDAKTIATFRLKSKTKELAETICQTNGTDLSKFLRNCCETLVSDYTNPQS